MVVQPPCEHFTPGCVGVWRSGESRYDTHHKHTTYINIHKYNTAQAHTYIETYTQCKYTRTTHTCAHNHMIFIVHTHTHTYTHNQTCVHIHLSRLLSDSFLQQLLQHTRHPKKRLGKRSFTQTTRHALLRPQVSSSDAVVLSSPFWGSFTVPFLSGPIPSWPFFPLPHAKTHPRAADKEVQCHTTSTQSKSDK